MSKLECSMSKRIMHSPKDNNKEGENNQDVDTSSMFLKTPKDKFEYMGSAHRENGGGLHNSENKINVSPFFMKK